MNNAILVFSLYFIFVVILTFVGTRQLGRKSTENFSEEFFVGGRRLGPVALAILVAAGAASTGTFVGSPGVSSQFGPGYFILFVTGQIAMNLFILGIFAKKMNIIGRRTKSETYIDILRHRYENYKPLIFVVLISVLTFLMAAIIAEFTGGSRIIQVMTGIPFEYSLIIFASIITLYTAFGGLKGVSIVGILQGIIMTVASIVLAVGYFTHFNGIGNIFEEVREIDPKLITPNFGGEFPLFEMLGYWLTYSVGLLGLPWAVQSVLGYRSTKTMRYAIVIGVVIVAFWTIFISSWGGVAGRVFSPDLEIPDLTIPVLSEGILPDALSGLVLAGVASAGQSTIAALFILASGSLVVNIYKVFINSQASESNIKKVSVLTVFAIGILAVILTLNPPPSLQILITFSMGGAASSLIAPMVLGLFWPRTNKYGAFIGVLSGLIGYIVFSQVNLGFDAFMQAPFLFAFPLSIIFTVLVSLITEKPDKETINIYFGKM